MSQFIYRLGDEKTNVIKLTIEDVLKVNIKQWGKYVPKILIAIIITYIIIGIAIEIYLRKNKIQDNKKINYLQTTIFILISIFPIIWYGVIKNHSYVHSFFTYRNLSIFILNIQLAIITFLGMHEENMFTKLKKENKI